MTYHVIYIPGLSDGGFAYKYALLPSWPAEYRYHFFRPSWNDGVIFQAKLDRLTTLIDNLHSSTNRIILIGTSAGGSAALNGFLVNPEKIHQVINICGRIRSGTRAWPSLAQASRNSPAFKQSVEMFEANELKLSSELRAKITTIRPMWDEVVPVSTVAIPGADNRIIPCLFHTPSIFLSLRLPGLLRARAS